MWNCHNDVTRIRNKLESTFNQTNILFAMLVYIFPIKCKPMCCLIVDAKTLNDKKVENIKYANLYEGDSVTKVFVLIYFASLDI